MNFRTDWPVFKKDPDCFLVYAAKRLFTETPVTRAAAASLSAKLRDAYPNMRVEIIGVHTLDRKSQKELSR